MRSTIHHNQTEELLQVFLYYIRERKIDCIPVGSDSTVSLSFIDLVKNSLLKKAANVGLNSDSLEVLNENLQQKTTKNETAINVLEKAVLDILIGNDQGCISFNLNGQLSTSINGQTLISIDLLEIINNSFPGLSLNSEEVSLEPVKRTEKQVLSIIKEKKYHSVKLIKKGNLLDRAECEEKLPVSKRVIDILKEADFQNIEIKQESGKPVYLNRTIKTKLQ